MTMPHPARKIRRSQRIAKRTALKDGRVVDEGEDTTHDKPVEDHRPGSSDEPQKPEENNT
jgi:hypothetical protein